MMTITELTAILEEEQERVEQRGERNRLLSEELSRVREKLTGQTALAARRLAELQKAQDENGELQNDIQILRMMVSKNDS